VTVVASDMRAWRAPEMADLLVSELLGSFGDNELSPECLDGAQVFLKPGGVSIPCDSVSYIAPVMSSKLWSLVAQAADKKKAFETTYVVKMHNFYPIASAQPLFQFEHPSPPSYPAPLCPTLADPRADQIIISTTAAFRSQSEQDPSSVSLSNLASSAPAPLNSLSLPCSPSSIAARLNPPALASRINNRRHKKLRFEVGSISATCYGIRAGMNF
jgi:hypothetical protein